jgi:hypothetical protein
MDSPDLKPCLVIEMLKDYRAFVNESDGLYGFHLNGDLAPWSDVDVDIDLIDAAIDQVKAWNTRTPTKTPAIAALIEACVDGTPSLIESKVAAAQEEFDGLPCKVEVKALEIHELRYGYWDAGYGYQIAHNDGDYYRIRCHGKVICKKIKGWSRALEWLQSHHDAIIRGALV